MKDITKIGVIRETTTPPDRRVPLTPSAARELLSKYPNLEISVQPSALRSFKNHEYSRVGLHLQENLNDCDYLVGINEVKYTALLSGKKYMFFSQLDKKPRYNSELLMALRDKNITLIDYECLRDRDNLPVATFGYWGGVIGAYNGLRALGNRTKRFYLKPAHEFQNMEAMYEHLQKIQPNPGKIVITGGGRAAKGALQTLEQLHIKQVSPEEFLYQSFNEPVFCRLDPWHFMKHKNGKEFDTTHFLSYPSEYESTFLPYAHVADLYIAAHSWQSHSPVFMTRDDMRSGDFNISVIADIGCNVNGPLPSTLRTATIASPFYDYDPHSEKERKPFSDTQHITVMAVDNLAGELPRDTSEDFSRMLIDNVFPRLLNSDKEGFIQNATIIKDGEFTEPYKYLEKYTD